MSVLSVSKSWFQKNISYDDLKTTLFHQQLMSFIIIAGLEQFNA
ncbi:hypothetical protein RO1_19470 [Roseburia intestinalis XB6B4]|jgi:hypothetical protein|uniref:Uncharacterized protein n=1 Tax=Roseburia intestinalis XB6B4 TaxID=718255 RepID=D4KYQ3_9FIRM|nr:hypothetical protein RO1_19470 [Roseburia intestinalis XB6B4]